MKQNWEYNIGKSIEESLQPNKGWSKDRKPFPKMKQSISVSLS